MIAGRAPAGRDVVHDVRHFHLFCGLGGGAKGFNRGQARVGRAVARMRCIGGVDVDPASVADFRRLTGVKGTLLDLFDRAQYEAFHGRLPPDGWREATPQDIQIAAGGERPHIVFLSAPCKGFSGLLSESRSGSAKYQALNRLTVRGVWLMLEAWRDDPPELIIFENVPRIATRGRALLEQIVALLRHFGYEVAETTHDCGELGGLAQSRKRFLLVARHREKVPPFLYQPPRRELRGVGEVLGRMLLPGDERAGPMHRVPRLQWQTWIRLAFVEAGSDWRSLNRLRVEDGTLADFGIAPDTDWHRGVLGVRRWTDTSGTIAGQSSPTNGAFSIADPRPLEASADRGAYGVGSFDKPAATVTSARSPGQGRFAVADPRIDGHEKSVQLGVRRWEEPAAVVTGKMFVGGGPHAVADPRLPGGPRFNNVYRIVRYGEASPAVAGPGGPGGGVAVADPRCDGGFGGKGKYRVTPYGSAAGTVIASSTTGQGACAVADPRYRSWHPGASSAKLKVTGWDKTAYTVTGAQQVASGALSVADPRPTSPALGRREAYLTSARYGVVPWSSPCGAVSATGQHDNGPWSVADPRHAEGNQAESLPRPTDRLVCVIRALDETWHRPFTTLELAALQSLIDPEEQLELDGLSDAAWRWRSDILVWEKDGKIDWGMIPAVHGAGFLFSTLEASDAWGIAQERAALDLLGALVGHRKFKQYLLTGMFIETSRRSGVHYLFRKLRPTLACSTRQSHLRILAALCLHPIAYYAQSWAGAMCPTDDVIAHLQLMRGDEAMFWRRANQHPPYRPEAGL